MNGLILNELFETNKDLISRSALSEEIKKNDFNWLKNKLQCLHLIARQPPIDIDQIKNQAIDEFSKSLISKLEENEAVANRIIYDVFERCGYSKSTREAIQIVNELTRKHKTTELEGENEYEYDRE